MITAGSSTVRGLAINNFRGDAIELRTVGNNVVEGNFLGTNAAGNGLPSNGGGIFVQNSPNNRIGGTTPAARNVIDATTNYAIYTPGACTGCPVDTGGGNVIQGNYLGTDKSGTGTITAPPGVRGGILLENANNVIGGTTAAARNVMSTVGVGGVTLQESGAHHNTIQGNYIGVDANGTAQIAPGSGQTGVTALRAGENTIGGATAGARNVIATTTGVSIFGVSGAASNNLIQNNYIGTNAAGTAALPATANAGSAVSLESASGNTVADNVLSNSFAGVSITSGSINNVVRGNFMGTNAAGTAALPNNRGVSMTSSTNTIGGTTAADRNVISGNTTDGIFISGGDSNTIQGNYVGVAVDGRTSLRNADNGIEISSGSKNVIGGTASGAGNVVATNGPFASVDGVTILGGKDNSVRGNSMHSNANLAIDLGGNGVTPNDAGDVDIGPNDLQNFPVLTSVNNGTIAGTLNSTPSTTFDVDFYSNTACDPSGNGQAAGYLGSTTVTTDASGNGSFTASPPFVGIGQYITATATAPLGSTSELSACVQATGSQTFTVNSNADTNDGNCDAANCTLREAIIAANATADRDTIAFNLPSGSLTIQPTSAYPAITNPLAIDATTQPGYAGAPIVEIDGQLAGANNNGLDFFAANNLVKGLVLNRFSNRAIRFTGGGLSRVEGSYFGTNVAGDAAVGTFAFSAIEMQNSPNNTIGGATPAARNVIVGSVMLSFAGSQTNIVSGNYIGTNAAGSAKLGNGGMVWVQGGVANRVGGPGGERNVIVSSGVGVNVTAGGSGAGTANQIQNNHIGTDLSGALGLGTGGNGISITTNNNSVLDNLVRSSAADGISVSGANTNIQGNTVRLNSGSGTAGIRVTGASNTIGGTTAAERNRIAGSFYGVVIESATASGNAVKGNYIGTNAGGTAAEGNAASGVWVNGAPGAIVSGNLIAGNGGPGVDISGANANGTKVEGNLIGTDVTGSQPLGNSLGIRNTGSPNTDIGGTSTAERNVVSASTNGGGMYISGPTATGITIQGNYIGTSADGLSAMGNGDTGVNVQNSAQVLIGGTVAGAGNVIAASNNPTQLASSDGIQLYSPNNTVQGNYIGTDKTGNADLGNRFRGILAVSTGNTIGGTTAAARNVVSGNGGDGILLSGANNTVKGNYVGLGADGTTAVGNDSYGIEVGATGNVVGGPETGARNVVSASTGASGIVVSGSTATVQGNYVGTDATGALDRGNSYGGIWLVGAASGNTIGGATESAGNLVKFNHAPAGQNFGGVILQSGTGNRVSHNFIYANDGLGIDLARDGLTANDVGDPDTGPNNRQNFPELSSAQAAAGQTVIQGVMRGGPSLLNMTLEFFASPACDGSGYGEGQTFLGSATIEDQSGADYPFVFIYSSALPAGTAITATATTESGDTSEFSACRLVTTDAAQAGPTFTVNTAADTTPNGCTANDCTLREAMLAANATAGTNSIHFNVTCDPQIEICGPGWQAVISPASELPTLNEQTNIDATTQPGYNGVPGIRIDGALLPLGAAGLRVAGSSSTLTALSITNVNGNGIALSGSGHTVQTSYIGLDALGADQGNSTGIFVEGTGHLIGGATTSHRNVISGNAAQGVYLSGAGASTNTIRNNYIGTTPLGDSALGNQIGVQIQGGSGNAVADNVIADNLTGVAIGPGTGNSVRGNKIGTNAAGTSDLGNLRGVLTSDGSSGNTIGGTTAADRNLISGNDEVGIWFVGTSTGGSVQGNYIGTNAAGTAALGNTQGVMIDGSTGTATIGGTTAGAGNLVSGNLGAGIHLAAGSSTVQGNTVGLSADGSALGNGLGIWVNNVNANTVGGTTAGARNVISGNAGAGVVVNGDGNTVAGNYIGLGLDGTLDRGNGEEGIRLLGGTGNTIGGAAAGAGNVISGNESRGIIDSGTNSVVQGNYVGTKADGTGDLGNGGDGIQIQGSGATVGGAAAGAGNVVSGNTGHGIFVYGTSGAIVRGNYAGTDATGTIAIPNGIDGIAVDGGSNNIIGGTLAGQGNLASGNTNQGIALFGVDFPSTTGNTVQGNKVGTEIDGTSPLGNGGDGIRLQNASNTLVGGQADGGGNRVAHNGSDGVVVLGAAVGNEIRRNSIVSNGDTDNDIGIDLAGNGVSGNDTTDADTGPNNLQNFPVLTAVTAEESSPHIVGMLTSAPNRAYRIDYYETPCAGPGDREGDRWLGWSLISTNADGVATIDTGDGLTSTIQEGEFVTATATDPDGNTSEFSACRAVTEAATPASATISIGSDQTSVHAGAQKVPTGGIDLADLRRTSAGTRSAPLDAVPLDAVPLDAVPLDAVTLGDLGLTAALLREVFGGVHLSEVPLDTPGGWSTKLAGTRLGGVPLNTITLADVYDLNEATNPDAVPLDAVPLDAVDLSGTPLDAVGLGAVALGATPLDAVPLDAVGMNTRAENAQDWCDLLNPPDPDVAGYGCPPINPSTETVLGAAIRGVPLDAVPLDAVPLDAVSPAQFPLDAVPLDAVPLDAVTLVGSPLDAVPLDAVNFAVSPLDAVPLDAVGPGIINCSSPYNCAGKKLGQAVRDGRLVPGATLGQLVQALKAVAGDSGASVADLIFGLPPNFNPELTFGDLFALVLGGAGAYDWSQLDLSAFPINEHSPDGGVITYRATFTATGGAATQTATIHATLPSGGRYKPGSTQLTSGATTIPLGEPQVGATQLEWTKQVERGVQYELTWQVHAPIALGTYAISANVIVPGMAGAALSAPVSVGVTQTLEPNDNVGEGALLEDETLYLGYMLPGDVDRHRIQIPTAYGSRVKITLSHLAPGTDLDLAVSGPPSPTLRNAPPNSIPLQNGQLLDTKVALDERGQPLPPETLDDVPTDAITTDGRVIRATSDNRGNADEEVTLLSQGETGAYIVQVSDYEGDSAMPYMLEVEVEGPPNLGNCDAPRSFPPQFAGQGVIGTMPTIPANVNTLILVNQQRLGRTYGNTAAANVISSLNQLAGRADLGIVGAVIPVESNPAVASAYAAWDGNPCSPAAANNVVSQIGQLVDSIEPDNLQYKVIVGGDDQIPFGRVADETIFANEEDYAASLTGPNNQYKSAYGNGLLLTDDVYAEEAAPLFLGHELFVPDQAVGRLVETPSEITGMISAFLAPNVNGAVTTQRSVTTGYDFLTDGANEVNRPFNAAFGANARTLINESWPARDATANNLPDDLEDSLFPPGSTLPPQLNSVNAHFDHTRLLPAAENAANRAANLYTSQDVRNRGASAVAQRILFSMGCHSGLATSDAVYGSADPLSKDWAQTFLAGGAFAWIGNTGFGLGDTVDVAYTERLHALFTGNLDGSLSLGEALAQAKQEYLSALGIVAGYDAKVLMQTTLYGLPMLRVGTGIPPANPAPLPLHTDPGTGLQAASFNRSPTFTSVTRPDGKFYRAETTQVTNRRPIEPVVSFDVTQPGKIAHGVVITSLQSLPDEANFDASFARVVNDKSEDEPEVVGEALHPAKIQSLSTFSHFASPATTRQNAVLIAGLYRSDGTPDPAGIGIHRLYSQIGGYVLYAPPGETDFTPPELGALETIDIGNDVGFAVDVTDADGIVKDVKVVYRDCAGVWRLSTLQNSGGNRWSGGGPLASTCEQIDYYVQAVDDAGNVAVSSKKVQIEPLTLPPATGATKIDISLAPQPPATLHPSGWFTGGVNVTLTSTPASALRYSLGGALQPYSGTFTVSGNGVHFVEALAADGSTATEAFAIDTSAPTVLMTTPATGAVYELGQNVKASFTCADSGSGPATCTGIPANGASLDTSSLGTKTITVTTTDVVGHSTTFSRTYEVVRRKILFVRSTGNGDIWAVDPNQPTAAAVQLTSGAEIDAEPEWSPDGEKIVFSSTRGPNVDIFVMDRNGGNITRLTTDSAIDTSPAWSPNGQKIAFASNRGQGRNWDIYTLDVANPATTVTRLTTNSAEDLLPAWSPNSQEIAFFSNRTGNGDIYKLAVATPGTTQVRMTNGATANGVDTEPAWIGSTIAFSSNRVASDNFEIFTVPSTGGAQTRITNQSGHDVTPSWSGDGGKIAFASNRAPQGGGLNFNIWTMDANGNAASQQPLVTGPAAEVFPDW